MVKQRENGLDILRIIAAIAVIACHVVSNFVMGTMERGDYDQLILLLVVRNVLTFAVPVFFLLSGAFVFSSKSTADYKSFYKKSFHKLVIPTLVFTFLYIFVRILENYLRGYVTDLSVSTVASLFSKLLPDIFRGESYSHLWYMFTLIVLYLMAPFVIRIKDMLGEKGFFKVSFILLLWGLVGNSFFMTIHNAEETVNTRLYWSLDNVINYLGMFMFGYTVHEWAKKQKEKPKAVLKALIMLVFAGLLCYLKYYLGQTCQITFITDMGALNPLCVLAAILMIGAFTIINPRVAVSKLSAATYWVYLVHPMVFTIYILTVSKIKNIAYSDYFKLDINPYFLIQLIICTIISFIIGMVIDSILGRCKQRKIAE